MCRRSDVFSCVSWLDLYHNHQRWLWPTQRLAKQLSPSFLARTGFCIINEQDSFASLGQDLEPWQGFCGVFRVCSEKYKEDQRNEFEFSVFLPSSPPPLPLPFPVTPFQLGGGYFFKEILLIFLLVFQENNFLLTCWFLRGNASMASKASPTTCHCYWPQCTG